MDVRSPFYQNVATALIGILFLNPIVSTAAEVTVAAGSNTSLTQAGNGVPVVNIATPNGNGLSHNKFSDYNVGQQGLILNNSTQKTQATQLGGLILGNTKLNGTAAKLILNEVNGANPTQLKGYTEVAGQGAHVVVANPHGITCNGCGFLNTPRVTLSTGKPIIENARLDRFDVDGGQIAIEGAGLNASNVDQFDLITRSAKLNAELHAKQLNVITGRNQVKAGDLAVTAKAADGSSKPQLAIDSSALGGMYAGAIRLVGTEAGVGVKLAGDLAASAGDIRIDAGGKLSLAQTVASADVRLQAQSLDLSGPVYAGQQLHAQASDALVNRQSLAARERVELKGGQLSNQGVIEAGVNPDNSRNLIGDVALSGDSLRNSGSVVARRGLSATFTQQLDNRGGGLSGKTQTTIEAASLNNGEDGRVLSEGSLTVVVDELDNSAGLIASGKDLSVTATAELHNQAGEISSQAAATVNGASLDNRAGLIAAGSALTLTAGSLDNSGQGTLSSQGSLSATVTGKLDNHGEGALISQGALSVQAQALDNSQGGVLSSRAGLTVTQAALNNQGGVIVAEQTLSLTGKRLDNSHGGLVSGKAGVEVDVDEVVDNSAQGTLLADGKLVVEAAELRNGDRGQVAAKGDLQVTVDSLSQQGDATTQAGELLSQGKLTLVADSIDNRQGGLIAATQGLDIRASNSLYNGGGEISTQGKADIRAQAATGQPAALLDNSGAGLIIGDQGLTLTVQRLLNHSKGVLSGRDSLVLIGASLDNSAGGILSSQTALSVELTGTLDNHDQGALLSGGSLMVAAASLDNSEEGLLSSTGTLTVDKAALNNQGGTLLSDGQLTITNGSLDNRNGGVISAKQALSIGTGQLDNQNKGVISGGADLTIVSAQLNNHDQGLIAAKGAATITATGLDQHAGGELLSETALTLDLQGGKLNNRGQGLIATPGALLLNNLGQVDNSAGGEISSAQRFLLKADQLDNSAGRIISGQALELQITQALLNNLKGAVSAATQLTVSAASLDNSGAGVLASQGDLVVTLDGELDNHDQGLISAGQVLTVTSDSLDNSNQGLLASGGALTLTTGTLDNQGGSLASQTSLNVTSADLDNRGGMLSSQQTLTLSAADVDNRDGGLIVSAAGLTLTADSLDSSRDLTASGGEVSAVEDLSLTVARLIQRQGRLIGEAGVSLDLLGGDLDNRGGLLFAKGPLTFANLRKLDNRDAGEVSSSQSYSLSAGEIDNGEKGRLISADSLTLDLGEGTLRNAGEGLISGLKGLTVNAGNLDNSGAGTLSSSDGALAVILSGSEQVLNNSGKGALVSKGSLDVHAKTLNNSGEGILSSAGDLGLTLDGKLDNHDGGLIDTQGALTVTAGEVDNKGGAIGSDKAATVTAASLDNSAGTLSSAAALTLTLTGKLLNLHKAQLASAGPLVLKAGAIDNQGGSLISQDLLNITGSSLNNADGGTLAARNALDIVLTGALTNSTSGLIHSEMDKLDIQAQSLDNAGGRLSSQGDLSLTLNGETDGTLGNQAGRIESRAGNLQLKKSSAVDNSNGGVLASLKGWLELVSTGLFDNDAGTAQAQSVKITAKGVDNQAGHISALTGDTEIIAIDATVNNQGGGLYADKLLKVTAGAFNNQGAEEGTGGKVAADKIDFGLSGALNNGFGLIESASTLKLIANGFSNAGGSLRALGSSGTTLISGGLLDNRSGLIESANTALQLDVSGLQNDGGRIRHVGTGTFGLSAANVMAAGGSLSSNGLLEITATSWVNSSVLQAGQLVLDIDSFTQTASGQLLASQSLSGTGGTWVNHGLLASDGSLSLTLTGGYSGNGRLTSLKDLSLKAASIDLPSTARISGGGLTTVTSTGLLSNRGKLTSAADLTLRAATLNNYGTLGSAKKLSLYAPTLRNEEGLIFSGEDMALRVNNFTNKYADVYSLGGIDLAKDDQGASANHLENLSGTLESGGTFSLRAALIDNRRDVLTLNDAGLYTAKIEEAICVEAGVDCSGKSNTWFKVTERNKLEVTKASAGSAIYAGSNLSITGDTLHNQSSLISAGGDIALVLNALNNQGLETGEVESSRIFRLTRMDRKYQLAYVQQAEDFTEKYWFESPGYDPDNIGDLSRSLATFLAQEFDLELVNLATRTELSRGDQSYAAIIQAGGNVSINASNRIDNGVIRPHFTYVGGGQKVGSSATDATGVSTLLSLNAQLPPKLQQQQINPLTLPGFSLPQGENGLFRLNGQNAATRVASGALGATGDSTLASSSVTVGAGQTAQGPVVTSGSTWSLQSGQGTASATGVTPIGTAALGVAGVQNLPSSTVPSASHNYLIETNPELTNLKQFLGSDYLLGNLGYTPDQAQKRLGDGLYEQRLIREAVVARTGQRFLAGLTSDEAMFRYLMDNAIAYKDSLNLSLGVTLTAEQVAALTHDIVWLEEYEVNGEKVLVPVLYLAQAKGRLAPNGALIQGQNLSLITGGNLDNAGTLRASHDLDAVAGGSIGNGGLIEAGNRLDLLAGDSIRNAQGGIIAGRDVSLTALSGDVLNERSVTTHESSQRGYTHREDFISSASRIEALNDLTLSAGRDIQNIGGALTAGRDLQLDAGSDLLIVSAQEHDLTKREARKSNSRLEQITQYAAEVSAGRDLTLSTERDLAVVASRVNAGQDLAVVAGGDVVIAAEANESHYEAHRRGGGKKVDIERSLVTQQGAELSAGGELYVQAGHDLTAVASKLKAGDEAYLVAGNDLSLLAAENTSYEYYYKQKKKSGVLSSSSKTTYRVDASSEAQGSLVSADSVELYAGKDIRVHGSDVVSTEGTALLAGNDIDIRGVTESSYRERYEAKKKSGLMGSGGIGVTLGSSSLKGSQQSSSETTRASTVGSVQGDVDIQAGKALSVVGSDVVAGRDIRLSGQEVTISAAENHNRSEQRQESKKSGLTLALSGTVGSAVNSAYETAQAARDSEQTGDSRMAALQGVKAGLSGYQAWQAAEQGGGITADNAGQFVGISLSLGTQKSSSQQIQEQQISQGSNLSAGRDLSIRALGAEDEGGDLRVIGSRLQAGRDLNLEAARDIQLEAAANTQKLEGKNKSGGGNVGISLGVSDSGAGLSIFANANTSTGKEKGNGTTWSETTLDAGRQLSLNSGRDTTLAGAQVNGEQIVADIGRDLRLRSLQDSDRFDAKQQSVSAGGSFTFGSMTGSGYFSASQSELKSRYDSVQEQTGLFAGQGGYQIEVGEHTQLDGAVIGSTAEAEKNRLSTGTLGWSDIRNQAEFSNQQQSVGVSSSGSVGQQFLGNMAGGLLSGLNRSGEDSSSTRAAVSEGSLETRDAENQKQDIANLNRDVEHAHQALSPIFDKEKEQRRLREVQMIAEIGAQTMDVIRTHGEIKAREAQQDPEQREKARLELVLKGNPNPSDKEIAEQIRNRVMAEYGTGSNLQRAAQAVTAALQGLAGGNVGAAVAGAAAPYVAQTIKDVTGDNDTARLMAHAVLGAVVANAQGNAAAAGAAGAVSGELVAQVIAEQLYGSKPGDLSEEQKQKVSALATLAAGLAGAAVGGDAANAVAGAQAGKNAVENNYLSAKEAERKLILERKEQAGTLTSDEAVELAVTRNLDKERDDEIRSICIQGNKSGGACSALVARAQQALESYGESVSYRLLYADLYPEDAANVSSILIGLDTESVTRDAAISAITQASGKSWEEVASQYDNVMQLHALAAALAGMYGVGTLKGQGNKAGNVAGESAKGTSALKYVDEPPFNPAGSVGAAQPWSMKGRIKHVELPTQGKIRYVPPENYNPSSPLPRGPNNGYIDKFGNEWTKGPSRTQGQAFEWDVQLSKQGRSQLGWATRDGSHLNVSLDGKITHK